MSVRRLFKGGDDKEFSIRSINDEANLYLTHLRAKIARYELKGDLTPVMPKENC